jgi:type VI secretion system protein ImpH
MAKKNNDWVNKIPFDMRAEILASLLMDQHTMKAEQFVMRPTGTLTRRSGRDVVAIAESFSYKNHQDEPFFYIDTSREGLYDTLPELLFLDVEEKFDDDIDRAEQLAKQEVAARSFLLPFEQLFAVLRIDTAHKERKAEQQLPLFLRKLWGLEAFKDCLNEKQILTLLYLLPVAHRFIGQYDTIAACFESVLGNTVSITYAEPPQYKIPPNQQAALGEVGLGDGFVLGDTFTDNIPSLTLTIKNVMPEEVDDYLEGGKKNKVLEKLLIPHFFPIEMGFEIEIEADKTRCLFETGSAQSIMGYSTFLADY